MSLKTWMSVFKQRIPALTEDLHKGSCGRIGVIGGSLEYTGAPYFAAISALKAGADLVHVFCTQSAAPVIKSYSPELIVHPLLDVPNAVGEISQWTERLHSLVVGPGLGRNPDILRTVLTVILQAPDIPLIVDADGIFMMTENPNIFRNLTRPLIITPNIAEYKRMTSQLTTLPDGVYLLKGKSDKILLNGCIREEIHEEGSFRRCGGQGDVLSGLVGVFSAWTHLAKSDDYLSAVVAASVLTRRCSKMAFEVYSRSMVASNLIEMLPKAFKITFD